MSHIIVIGAGITGVTTAYSLLQRGYQVTVIEKNRYEAMETSFANGGQLSASNAEVWTNWATIAKGVRWMAKKDAPLLLNPTPSWHKYSWIARFIASIPEYRQNTIETTRLAIAARRYLFEIADRENIQFDLERRGILHIYDDKRGFDAALRTNQLLAEGGLERRAVTVDEMKSIEPTLQGKHYGGFFTPSDSTGDIHKFTRGLAAVCRSLGATFVFDAGVQKIDLRGRVSVSWRGRESTELHTERADAIIVCAGVFSRDLASMLGDSVPVYPVKGYSITIHLDAEESKKGAPWVSLLDDKAKIVTSRLGVDRFRVAGTAEFNGRNLDIRSDRIRPLVDWTRRQFPFVSTSRVVPWSGLRPMMPNMMPHVARGSNPRVFYNTGHGHLGWTLSCATADLVAAMVDRCKSG